MKRGKVLVKILISLIGGIILIPYLAGFIEGLFSLEPGLIDAILYTLALFIILSAKKYAFF
ncbi:hypothetical protein FJZ22_00910 [Candidatus Pacearchaeota archaeon]|nr:hypothetical protein [Candidatus Pacearchaeota archaeon]